MIASTRRLTVGLGLVGIAAALSVRRMGDFDLPWHLATGRLLARTRALPEVDPFAYTHRPWDYLEPVTDTLLYAVHWALGPLGLQLLLAATAVAIALVLHRRSRGAGVISWFGVALALAAMNAWLLVRPATFGFLFTALMLWAMDHHRQFPGSRTGRGALASTAALQLLWANSHGSLTLGLGLSIAYAGYRLTCRVAAGRLGHSLPQADGRDAGTALLVACAAVGATALSPAGLRSVTAAHTSAAAPLFTEWARPTLSFLAVTEPATGLLVAAIAAALAFGREPDGRRFPNAFNLGLVVVAAIMIASAVRLIAFAAILTAPFVARRLAARLPGAGEQPGGDWRSRRIAALSVSALVLCGPLLAVRHYTSLGVGFEPAHFPDGAVHYVREARPSGRMWNFLPFGGYLVWRLYPDHLVLVDGRTGWVHDLDTVRRAVASNHDPAALAGLVRDFDIEWAITRSREGEPFGGPLATSRDWAMVYFDDVGSVYVRAGGPNRRLAGAGYRVFRHLMPPAALLQMAARRHRPADLVHDGTLAVTQAPTSPRAAFLLACGGLAAGDRAVFDDGLGRLRRLAPEHPSIEVLQAAWAEGHSPQGPDLPR